jgi:hypothetical protein
MALFFSPANRSIVASISCRMSPNLCDGEEELVLPPCKLLSPLASIVFKICTARSAATTWRCTSSTLACNDRVYRRRYAAMFSADGSSRCDYLFI